jgi:glucokinase
MCEKETGAKQEYAMSKAEPGKTRYSNNKRYVVAVDLGGTKIFASVVDENLGILSRVKRKTGTEGGAKEVYRRIKESISASVAEAGLESPKGFRFSNISAIGIGSPGPLDFEKGVILETPNIGFKNFPLKDKLDKDFGIPITLENDVSAGVYGECKRGAGRGYRHVVGVFPGTGVGGGLVLNGKLYRGATGNAGEVGHTIINMGGSLCGCGQYGCVEAYCSRVALTKDAVASVSKGANPALFKEAGTDFKRYKSGVFGKAYARKDPDIVKSIERSAWFLGIGMANCVNILSPELIILGGGLVEKLGEPYLKIVEESMRAHALPKIVEDVKVVRAMLGDDAVLIGAASLAYEELGAPKESTQRPGEHESEK